MINSAVFTFILARSKKDPSVKSENSKSLFIPPWEVTRVMHQGLYVYPIPFGDIFYVGTLAKLCQPLGLMEFNNYWGVVLDK